MPYFLYKIHKHGELSALEYITRLDTFQEAKLQARRLRAQLAADKTRDKDYQDCIVKMVFAADETEAADLLSEKREEPILREWEK